MPQYQLKGCSTTRVGRKVGGERKSSGPSQSKKDLTDLAEALIDNINAWDSLETGKADIMSCIETLEPSVVLKRMCLTIENISSLDELIKYCYNLRLRVEWLSIHSVFRQRD